MHTQLSNSKCDKAVKYPVCRMYAVFGSENACYWYIGMDAFQSWAVRADSSFWSLLASQDRLFRSALRSIWCHKCAGADCCKSTTIAIVMLRSVAGLDSLSAPMEQRIHHNLFNAMKIFGILHEFCNSDYTAEQIFCILYLLTRNLIVLNNFKLEWPWH